MVVRERPDPIKEDFRKFLYLVWQHISLPDPTPVQYDIAVYLQRGPKRCVIEAFRGVGKSFVTSAYVCWLLYCNPQLKIMVVSASKERADAFSTFTKRLIAEIPFLQHLKPRDDQRNSVISFDVGPAIADHSPSVKSVGITGQLTGSRADVIIADDIEVPGNSATQAMRDKISELVKEFDAILKPLPTSRIIYLGTPQTEMSLYNALPERGYEIRVWPTLYPNGKEVDAYKGRLAPIIMKALQLGTGIAGEPTDPKRFTKVDLMERRVSYGKAGFALQFMLDTTLSDLDRYPLKLQDLIVTSVAPNMAPAKFVWGTAPEQAYDNLPTLGFTGDRYYRPMWKSETFAEYTGCVMAIDPSGRGKDETGYAIVKILHGQLFLVALGGLSGGYDDHTLGTLAGLAEKHSVNHVIVEANFGDGMFTKLLTPVMNKVHRCAIEEVKSTGQKEQRIIDTLEPVLMQHRLIVDQRVIEEDFRTAEADPKYSAFYQLTRITRDRGALAHDDRLDALAIAVAYWVEQMARDVDKAVNSHKAKLLEAELKGFHRHVFGAKGAPKGNPNWRNGLSRRRSLGVR